MKRKLSGIFFFGKDEEGNREPTCIEDLTEKELDDLLSKKEAEPEFVKSLVKSLCKTINEIGDLTGIYKE